MKIRKALIHRHNYRWNDNDLIKAVKESFSFREVLSKLLLAQAGSNYNTIRNRIKELNLSTEHMKGQGWKKGTTDIEMSKRVKFPLSYYLKENIRTYNSSMLKKRLLKENYFQYKCYNCENTRWLDNPIPLELEHINGNKSDNRINNLTLLCPNCHALTSTYRGRNIGRYKQA